MPSWEYLFIMCSSSSESSSATSKADVADVYACFVALGQQGWEYVETRDKHAIFKRPTVSPHVLAPSHLLPLVSVAELP